MRSRTAIYLRPECYPRGVITTRRKTSFEVDFAKVDRARALLGTRTMTETIDAALDEVIALEQRRALVEILFTADVLDLDQPDVMADAWR
jgi:hypothetical protein